MGETTDSIKRDIEHERHEFEQNIDGIESRVRDTTDQVQHKVEDVQQKVKDATDWRTQFEHRPMLGVALAFGGGVLLASMMGGGDNGGRRQPYSGGYQYQPQQFQSYSDGRQGGTEIGRQHASSTFENVKGALMGVAAAQVKSMLSQNLPGFDDEYRQVESEREGRSGSSQQSSYVTSNASQSNNSSVS